VSITGRAQHPPPRSRSSRAISLLAIVTVSIITALDTLLADPRGGGQKPSRADRSGSCFPRLLDFWNCFGQAYVIGRQMQHLR
jgi:hypothetical protein